jgi:membrane protein DedA with SNARE-associated domain
VGFLRALASFVAGASVMPYRRFPPHHAAAAGLWASGFVLLGSGVDVGWRRVEPWTNAISVICGGGVALLTGLVWLRRWVERQACDGMRT